MRVSPAHILFCDFEGEFPFSDTLTRIGFLVDHIRPDSLRHVTVGDHQAYIFSFRSDEDTATAVTTCEKLKAAQLPTALILMSLSTPTPQFLNHHHSPHHADAYLAQPQTATCLLDALDSLIGCPMPPSMKGSLQLLNDEKERRAQTEFYKIKVEELETKIQEMTTRLKQGSPMDLDKALAAQREAFKPKLQALLKGQKLQAQTETERLKFELSEMEAKLMDREVRIKDLVAAQQRHKDQVAEMVKAHERSQQALRDFYREKMKDQNNSGQQSA